MVMPSLVGSWPFLLKYQTQKRLSIYIYIFFFFLFSKPPSFLKLVKQTAFLQAEEKRVKEEKDTTTTMSFAEAEQTD